MYESGQGVAQDYVRAYMWLSLAAPSLNDEFRKKAEQGLDLVTKKMTPAQIASARKMAKQCRESDYKKCD